MNTMKTQNTQTEIIIKALLNNGSFAISEIEKGNQMSRSGIGKTLRKLVLESVLIMTPSGGTAAKYKLAINNQAVEFLFQAIEQFTINEIALAWDINAISAKKYIKKFVDEGLLIKHGLPPQKIIYAYARTIGKHNFSAKEKDVLEKYYAYTTPDGQLLKGEAGFVYWAEKRSGRKDIKKLVQEYIETRSKYYTDKDRIFLIDATDKLDRIFGKDVYLKKLFHRDYDALPVFGKTYLSQMVRIAKSGHANTPVMTHIVEKIEYSLQHIIEEYAIDAIGFIPPTVFRKTQLMTFLSRRLNISLPKISITKETSFVPVQQKSLKKIEDRILNASKTIVVSNEKKFKNVLLIDDVTGSGATLNETAKKIVQQGIAQNVYGFTITGSAKAGVFDVISEA